MIYRPQIMGILNVTPDSFTDGGKYNNVKDAIAHAHKMIEQGADIIDIGAESTRPGAKPVDLEEELRRVIPVARELVKEINLHDVQLSIDTYKPEVAQQCLDLGVSMINDVKGLTDPRMAKLAAKYDVPIIIMHTPGNIDTLHEKTYYSNVTKEVKDFLRERIDYASSMGIEKIIIDPGFGFGKTPGDNYELLRNLNQIKDTGYPVLIGTSGKRFEGITKEGSLEVLLFGLMNGAGILRVHDASLARRAIGRYEAIRAPITSVEKQVRQYIEF